jgi:hypothetical protein
MAGESGYPVLEVEPPDHADALEQDRLATLGDLVTVDPEQVGERLFTRQLLSPPASIPAAGCSGSHGGLPVQDQGMPCDMSTKLAAATSSLWGNAGRCVKVSRLVVQAFSRPAGCIN